MGKVQIPIRVLEDPGSCDLDYSNPAVQSAMENAFHSILSIALTTCHHPLWDLFRQWTTLHRSDKKIHEASNFLSSHPVPILLGDAALSEPLLTRLTRCGVWDKAAVFVIARILFGLVTLRTYLRLQPSHDAHIWKLWSEGKFKRRLTPAERALEACTMTRTEVGGGGTIKPIPSLRLRKLNIIPCMDPCIEDDTLLVDYPPTSWEESQDHQLSGPGATEMQELKSKPRPKPRLAMRQREPDEGKETGPGIEVSR
jgi:hypothetical protein